MYNRSVQLKAFLKNPEMYDCARQDLYAESSEVHNFDINRCDAENQKKHIAANWVAPPVTLTGSLREHICAALVGAEKWPTFVIICACRYVSACLSRWAVIYVNVCVCVCPCAIYFRLLFFKGSENTMITRATHSLRTIVGACCPDAEVGYYDFLRPFINVHVCMAVSHF